MRRDFRSAVLRMAPYLALAAVVQFGAAVRCRRCKDEPQGTVLAGRRARAIASAFLHRPWFWDWTTPLRGIAPRLRSNRRRDVRSCLVAPKDRHVVGARHESHGLSDHGQKALTKAPGVATKTEVRPGQAWRQPLRSTTPTRRGFSDQGDTGCRLSLDARREREMSRRHSAIPSRARSAVTRRRRPCRRMRVKWNSTMRAFATPC